MINGVMHIVAAVLFAVIAVKEGISIIWLGVAAVYLITGVINLAIHALKIRKIEKAAKKAAKKAELNHQTTAPMKVENETTAGGQ